MAEFASGEAREPAIPTAGPRRRVRWSRRILAIVLALIVGLASYAAYGELVARTPGGGATLVVYTYASLFGGASCQSPVFDTVFGAFERAHGVHVQVECPAGTLASTLLAQRNSPVADLVIGLDEITAPQASQLGLLVPYVSPQLANVPPSLVASIAPDHAVTPYEWGYLAIDVNASFAAQTHGEIDQSAFPSFAQNLTWAKQLMVEDPTTDITGEEFLAWQAMFYSQVLHQDWTTWWKTVDRSLQFAPDWSTAYTAFTGPPPAPAMVVSYSTDPAAAAFSGSPGAFRSVLSSWNGTEYGWRTVYGIGIVAGSSHQTLDQQFLDWFLEGPVQSQIPTNEWEYPANATVGLPPVFQNATNVTGTVALNGFTTPSQLAGLLPGWVNTWQTVDNQYG